MTIIRTLFTSVVLVAASATTVLAQQFAAAPADYRYATAEYVESRLEEASGARIQIDSDPYPVMADFGRYGEIEAWAVDVRVKSRIGSRGGYGGYMTYTVIFVDGEPIAFEDEIRNVETVRRSRYAGRG